MRERNFTTYTACSHCVSHAPVGKYKKKKKSAAISVQIRSASSSELLEGATGTDRACQAQGLFWAG